MERLRVSQVSAVARGGASQAGTGQAVTRFGPPPMFATDIESHTKSLVLSTDHWLCNLKSLLFAPWQPLAIAGRKRCHRLGHTSDVLPICPPPRLHGAPEKKKSSRLRGGSRRLTSRVSGGDYRASKTRARKRKIRCPTAVRPKIPHSNCCKIVPNRPLRGRRGRFGTLLQLLECGIFGRTAVSNDSPSTGKSTTQRPTFTPLVTKNGDACAVPWLPGPAAALARAQPRAHAWGSL